MIVSWSLCVRWSRGEKIAEETDDRDAEKESSGRRRSRQDRKQDLEKKMETSDALSDRFESRGELRAVDTKYVVFHVSVWARQ